MSWGHRAAVRPADEAAIRAVITRQLDAFAQGDRSGSYAAGAPNVHHRFSTAAAFWAMARRNYAPLFNIERNHFAAVRGAQATATEAETWSQDVDVITRDGERWSAVYGLERQPDGSIAITSCVLVRRSDAAAALVRRGRPGFASAQQTRGGRDVRSRV